MKKKRVLLLDKRRIDLKLRRMAYEIWERNNEEKELILIGIEKGGRVVADNLAAILKEIAPINIINHSIIINKRKPLNGALDIDQDLTGKAVVLVDDVANSGKTIMYSLNTLLSYDLRKVMVAVLVDRKHKSFPIASDIVGHSVATTLQEHIEVDIEGEDIKAVYLE